MALAREGVDLVINARKLAYSGAPRLLVTVTDPRTHLTTQVPAPQLPAPMVGGSARASTSFYALFANPADPAHFQALSAAELRLISEWLDIGAQYYNDPFAIPQ